MSKDSPWAAVVNAAGAAGAIIALVYAVGSIVMSLRYEGFGLSGQEAVAVTPREVLLFAGARSLVIWAAVGFAITLALRRLDDEAAGAVVRRLKRPPGLLAAAALVVVLVAVSHVVWPVAVVAALAALLKVAASWRARPVLRGVASAAAVAAIAIAFEADRLRYQLDVSCIAPAAESHVAGQCGILVGQNDRGVYVGVPPASTARAARYALVFVSAAQVASIVSHKQPRTVIDEFARRRRTPLVERLLGIKVQ
jgi:hypothetical protein